MEVNKQKKIIKAVLILGFVLLMLLMILGFSNILIYFNSGAERESMLHSEFQTQQTYVPQVIWTPLKNNGRRVHKEALGKIEKDYIKSWYVKSIGLKNNSSYGVDDYYTDSSRVNFYQAISYNKRQNIVIDGTTLSHKLTLNFYSEDGTLVVFTDDNVKHYQRVYKKNKLQFIVRDTSSYKVMMLLEDGFWRVRHLQKIKLGKSTSIPSAISSSIDWIKAENDKIIEDNKQFIIKGINYYPKDLPWAMFSDAFNPSTVEADFKRIKKIGLNTVRIFVPFVEFGKSNVSKNKLNKLEQVLDIAEKQQLKVIVTLFDFYGDYTVLNWTETHTHARRIVGVFKNHPAILAWDVKNEPDLDFKARGQLEVTEWLMQMITLIKEIDKNHMVTVGWANLENAHLLKDEVDIVSYHYYKSASSFIKKYNRLKARIPNKPLILQEFGKTSYQLIWNPFVNGDRAQANYHKKMQAHFRKDTLAFMSWCLYDYDTIPSSVVGKLFWRKRRQQYFGFITTQGVPKQSFSFITY